MNARRNPNYFNYILKIKLHVNRLFHKCVERTASQVSHFNHLCGLRCVCRYNDGSSTRTQYNRKKCSKMLLIYCERCYDENRVYGNGIEQFVFICIHAVRVCFFLAVLIFLSVVPKSIKNCVWSLDTSLSSIYNAWELQTADTFPFFIHCVLQLLGAWLCLKVILWRSATLNIHIF